MQNAAVVLWVFGVVNIVILILIVWKLGHLEVSQKVQKSPIQEIRDGLERQQAAKQLEREEKVAIAQEAEEEEEPKSKPKPELPSKPKPKPKPLPIEYGIFTAAPPRRTPVVMMRSTMSPTMLARFQKSPLFSCSGPIELEKMGLKKTVDYPKSKDTHTYYEGYFHGLRQATPYFSRNPRNGKNFEKPAAGDFLRAYYEGLRRVNNATFELLRRRLYNSAVSRRPHFPYNDSCGYVSRWIGEGKHFSDLSVQIHWGSHIGKATHGDELFWHSDAENSLLHFCVTVLGKRTLHSMRAPSVDGKVKEILEEQAPGGWYLSSSALINHAPEYPATDGYANRIAAIQARFIYLTEDLKAFRASVGDGAGWSDLVKILSETLSTSSVVSPSVALVDSILNERRNDPPRPR